jgi:uncharacterized repeat protein (TIGR03833 family)
MNRTISKGDSIDDIFAHTTPRIGEAVLVVQKQDQSTGKLTDGIVKKILKNSPEHPHGIKVILLTQYNNGRDEN